MQKKFRPATPKSKKSLGCSTRVSNGIGNSISSVSPWHLRCASIVLKRGGIIAYPTESVYGLGCDPDNSDAVARLLQLKRRPASKGLILVAAELGQLEPYIQIPDAAMKRRLMDSWPGPITWLVPAAPYVPEWLRGKNDTLAVRVSAHPVVRGLCLAFGDALVSTSANISNRPALCSPLAIQRVFGDSVDYIVHGPLGGLSRPSEIRDAISGRVVRPGQAT